MSYGSKLALILPIIALASCTSAPSDSILKAENGVYNHVGGHARQISVENNLHQSRSKQRSQTRKKTIRSSRKTITISGDRGGELIRYARKVKISADRGDLVRIGGLCDSACTLYLALPRRQLCLLPGAAFRFHHPYGSSKRNNQVAARYMMRSYPGWVRSWLRSNGGLSGRLKLMNHAHAAKYIKKCPGESYNRVKNDKLHEIGRRPSI